MASALYAAKRSISMASEIPFESPSTVSCYLVWFYGRLVDGEIVFALASLDGELSG
jgi:hypothetical protein